MADQFDYIVLWPGEPEDSGTAVTADSRRHAAERVFLEWARENPFDAVNVGTVDMAVRSKSGIAPPVRFRVSMEWRAVAQEVAGG